MIAVPRAGSAPRTGWPSAPRSAPRRAAAAAPKYRSRIGSSAKSPPTSVRSRGEGAGASTARRMPAWSAVANGVGDRGVLPIPRPGDHTHARVHAVFVVPRAPCRHVQPRHQEALHPRGCGPTTVPRRIPQDDHRVRRRRHPGLGPRSSRRQGRRAPPRRGVVVGAGVEHDLPGVRAVGSGHRESGAVPRPGSRARRQRAQERGAGPGGGRADGSDY